MKTRYIIPNFFTGLNFIFGVFATLLAASFFQRDLTNISIVGKDPMLLSAWMITWCVLLDKLDGFAAKMMNASSEFGAQFDSMADMIAFGIAPAFLMYFYLHHANPAWAKHRLPLLLISLTIFVLCNAMRLARYNTKDAGEYSGYFLGMPTTFAGATVSSVILLADKYAFLEKFPKLSFLFPMLLVFLGLMMISPLYLPKLAKRKNRFINYVQLSAVALGYIFAFSMIFPEFLFSLIIIYGGVGFTYCILNKEKLNFRG